MWFRQAITTEYKGPTNSKPGRIVARAQAGRVTVEWDHGLDVAENHARAARTAADRWKWTGEMHGGGAPTGGYVFVFVTADSKVSE